MGPPAARIPADTAANGSAGSAQNGSSSSGWTAAACGTALWPPLAVAATCKDAAALAAPLRAAGRLDCSIALPAPTADSRAAILASAAATRGVQLEAQHLRLVADRADGFDAADLGVLLDRALHVAVRRQLAAGGSSSSSQAAEAAAARAVAQGPAAPPLQLTEADVEAALDGFTPAAFWGTGSHKGMQAGVDGWADVGGMEEARHALHEALELPTRHARLVAKVRGGRSGWCGATAACAWLQPASSQPAAVLS